MMPIRNMSILEAVESSTAKVNDVVAQVKKTMNTCALTRYTSQDKCLEIYETLFTQSLPNQETLSIEDWGVVYTKLFSDPAFFEKFCIYAAMWQPRKTDGMFKAMMSQIKSEMASEKERKVTYLGNALSTVEYLLGRIQTAEKVVVRQTLGNMDAAKYFGIITQTLTGMTMKINNMIQEELAKSNKDDVTPTLALTADQLADRVELQEDAKELIDILEHAEDWVNHWAETNDLMNETIINNAKMKVKQAAVKSDKIQKAFDEFVMKKFHAMQVKRRNAKHSELVGESLRIMREMKRLMRSGVIWIFSPALAVVTWVVSLFIDKKTDANDRRVLVGELKDEIEIIEEKIAMAERNGDDKAKIELIRIRQKYYKEYERINRITFDKARMAKDIHG